MLPACKSHASRMQVALMSHGCGFGWLCSTFLHSSFFLLPSPQCGFGVALGGLRRLLPIFLLSAFCFRLVVALPRPSAFILLPSAFAPCPGTIELPQTPVFDQPYLFNSVYRRCVGCILPVPTVSCRRLPSAAPCVLHIEDLRCLRRNRDGSPRGSPAFPHLINTQLQLGVGRVRGTPTA